jgi:hypothetical protein
MLSLISRKECGLTIHEPMVIGKVFNNMINGTDNTK